LKAEKVLDYYADINFCYVITLG